MAAEWEAKGRLALVGRGMDPGLSQVFAAHAAKHQFDEIDEINVRDGGDLRIEGHGVRHGLLHLDHDRGVPQPADRLGAGPRLSSRWSRSRSPSASSSPRASARWSASRWSTRRSRCCRVASSAPGHLQVRPGRGVHQRAPGAPRHRPGPQRPDPRQGRRGPPRDVVAALVPDPATLGDHMVGRAVVGTHVTGIKDGRPRELFHYQMCDAQETMARLRAPAGRLADRVQPHRVHGAARRGRLAGCRGPVRGVVRPRSLPRDPGPGRHPPRDVEIEPGHASPAGARAVPAASRPDVRRPIRTAAPVPARTDTGSPGPVGRRSCRPTCPPTPRDPRPGTALRCGPSGSSHVDHPGAPRLTRPPPPCRTRPPGSPQLAVGSREAGRDSTWTMRHRLRPSRSRLVDRRHRAWSSLPAVATLPPG